MPQFFLLLKSKRKYSLFSLLVLDLISLQLSVLSNFTSNLFEVNIKCAQPAIKSKQGGITVSADGWRSRGPSLGSRSGNALSSKYTSSKHNLYYLSSMALNDRFWSVLKVLIYYFKLNAMKDLFGELFEAEYTILVFKINYFYWLLYLFSSSWVLGSNNFKM